MSVRHLALAIAVTVVVVVAAASSAFALGVSATVPNNFVRTCSHWTGDCSAYQQVNGRYNPSVPSVYHTNWSWLRF